MLDRIICSKKKVRINQSNINFYTNLITLIANVVIGLYYTPFLINNLGVSAYGVVPLALIMNQYISVLTVSLTNSFTRFYTISLQSGDCESASRNISTCLNVILGLILILLLPCFFIIKNLSDIFSVPSDFLTSAKILFGFTICSFFISLFSSLLNVTLFALNRLDLMNLIKVLRNFLKLAFVIMFFNVCSIDLIYIGISNFLAEIIVLLFSILFFLHFKPQKLRLSFLMFDKSILFAISGMTLWTVIHMIGDTTLYRIDNIIVNNYYGINNSGVLGAISEFGNYIILLVSVLGSLASPLILISYSKNDHDQVLKISEKYSLIIGVVSAILAGIIAAHSKAILLLWLGDTFVGFSEWLVIKIVPIPFIAAGAIMSYVFRAWNQIGFAAIMTVIIGLLNFAVMFLLSTLNIEIKVILALGSISVIFQGFLLNYFCAYRIYPKVKSFFVVSSIKILGVLLIVYKVSELTSTFLSVSNLFELLILMSLNFIVFFLLFFYVVFTKIERETILSLLKIK